MARNRQLIFDGKIVMNFKKDHTETDLLHAGVIIDCSLNGTIVGHILTFHMIEGGRTH